MSQYAVQFPLPEHDDCPYYLRTFPLPEEFLETLNPEKITRTALDCMQSLVNNCILAQLDFIDAKVQMEMCQIRAYLNSLFKQKELNEQELLDKNMIELFGVPFTSCVLSSLKHPHKKIPNLEELRYMTVECSFKYGTIVLKVILGAKEANSYDELLKVRELLVEIEEEPYKSFGHVAFLREFLDSPFPYKRGGVDITFLENLIESIANKDMRKNASIDAIKTLVRQGDIKTARDLAGKQPEEDLIFAFNIKMANDSIRKGNIDDAIMYLMGAPKGSEKDLSLHLLIHELIKEEKHDTAADFISEVSTAPLKVGCLDLVINSLLFEKKPHKAAEIVKKVVANNCNVESWNNIPLSVCNALKNANASDEEMKSFISSLGWAVDHHSFKLLIERFLPNHYTDEL